MVTVLSQGLALAINDFKIWCYLWETAQAVKMLLFGGSDYS